MGSAAAGSAAAGSPVSSAAAGCAVGSAAAGCAVSSALVIHRLLSMNITCVVQEKKIF